MSSSMSTATETLPDRCLHASLESCSFHLLLHLLRLQPVDRGEERFRQAPFPLTASRTRIAPGILILNTLRELLRD